MKFKIVRCLHMSQTSVLVIFIYLLAAPTLNFFNLVCRVSMCLYSLYLPSDFFRLMHGSSDYFVKKKNKYMVHLGLLQVWGI
jgi:hypothetical protein